MSTSNAASAAILKILVAGGFGVGKTTLVGAVSEITPLRTEETLTAAGIGVDDLTDDAKSTTTVAMDFGRITLDDAVLMLFGTPGQERFWFMWRDLIKGAAGAVVLVDTRRLESSFAAVDFFDQHGTPYVIAVNRFADAAQFTPAQVADALQLDPGTPVLTVDARERADGRRVLLALVDHLITRNQP